MCLEISLMVVLFSMRKGDCFFLFIRKIEISGGGGLGREEGGRGGRRGREKIGDNVDEVEVWVFWIRFYYLFVFFFIGGFWFECIDIKKKIVKFLV